MRTWQRPLKILLEKTTVGFSGMWRPHLFSYNADRTVSLIEPVASWLDAHAPGWTVQIDRGDWGEGCPDFIIQVPSQEIAAAFVRAFGAPAEGKHTFSDDETVIEFTTTDSVFADGIGPNPNMVAWLEANVPDHRLAQTDDYDAPYTVFRLTFPSQGDLLRMISAMKAAAF